MAACRAGSHLQGCHGTSLSVLCIFMGSPSTLDDTSFQVHQSVMIKFKRGVQLGNVAEEENGAGAARLATVASAGTETTVHLQGTF